MTASSSPADERSPPSPSRPRRHPAVLPRPRRHREAEQPSSGPAAIKRPRRHQAVTPPSSGHAAIKRSRCGHTVSSGLAAIKRLQPPLETSPALTLMGRWIKYSDDAIPLPSPPSAPLSCSRRRLHAALAAFMRPSLPSCGPRRLHAALAAFMRPSPPSCGPPRLHAALAAFMRPSPSSCGPRRLHAALAAFVRPLVRPLPHLSSQPSRRREAGHLLADALIILVPSLVLAGGTVEEQIDETDIRKIPQIVWAESGS